MTPDQLHRLATNLRHLADRIDTEAGTAIQRAHDWQPGPRPGDNHSTPPQPGDPDYQGPLAHELDQIHHDTHHEDRRSAAIAARIHHHLTRTLDQLDTNTRDLNRQLDLLRAHRPPRTALTLPNPGEGLCLSHARVGIHDEPEATHPDGRTRHKDLCYWCAQWRHLDPDAKMPPIALVRWRARNLTGRVTPQLLDRLGIKDHSSA